MNVSIHTAPTKKLIADWPVEDQSLEFDLGGVDFVVTMSVYKLQLSGSFAVIIYYMM